MNLALTIFSIAFLLAALILLNKRREVARGKPWVSLGSPELDTAVYDTVEFVIYMLTHASVKTTRQLFRKALLSSEKLMISLFEKLNHRFAAVSDIITGKDIPKNRGSVSFFLKNVEASKKSRMSADSGRCKKI